jgi:hypothetical protein
MSSQTLKEPDFDLPVNLDKKLRTESPPTTESFTSILPEVIRALFGTDVRCVSVEEYARGGYNLVRCGVSALRCTYCRLVADL